MKICPVGAELFHLETRTDGLTGRDGSANVANLTVAFRSFAYAPKNGSLINVMLGSLVASSGSR
jgi:hypothetical protein